MLMFMHSLFRFTRRMKTGPVLNSLPAWTSNPFSGLRAQQRRLQWSNTPPVSKRCVCIYFIFFQIKIHFVSKKCFTIVTIVKTWHTNTKSNGSKNMLHFLWAIKIWKPWTKVMKKHDRYSWKLKKRRKLSSLAKLLHSPGKLCIHLQNFSVSRLCSQKLLSSCPHLNFLLFSWSAMFCVVSQKCCVLKNIALFKKLYVEGSSLHLACK